MYLANQELTNPSTEHDERLICGSAPVDIETATLTLANQPVTGQAIGEFIYPCKTVSQDPFVSPG